MKRIYDMESVLIAITGILCTTLFFKLLYSLRSALPWRVNCWFCNNYFWVKFIQRNCWTCPKCEQYNGFTKDGDYNRPLFSPEQSLKSPKVFHSSPAKNGLCKMCNINQQLKVAQLANFVPMNERNFDDEIETYRMQLEKAYKLCSPCKKVVQMKLHREKETLLGSKLLETRFLDKNNQNQDTQNKKLQNFVNNTSMYVAGVILILVSIECRQNLTEHKNLYSTISNLKDIFMGILERIVSIVKMKTLMTFPSLENYLNTLNNFLCLDMLSKQLNGIKHLDHMNLLTQKALGGFVCLIQIIGHVWNINKLKHTIVIDLLWSVLVILSIGHHSVTVDPIIMSLVKFASAGALLMVYRSMKTKTVKAVTRKPVSPKKLKNLSNNSNKTVHSLIDDEDMPTVETDDDVSLSKYGLHNYSDSSNETIGPLNSSIMNGRSFTPRSQESVWSKPKLNSTFCVNSVHCKSPSSVSETVFAKPVFNDYQKLAKDDSDSDLDESISSLCIGSPKKSKKTNSVFSLRKFTATPNFAVPTPLNRARPLISPSKLGHSTSWVAGGYWGSDSGQIFNINGSRSSSQSSGFESQASSMNQRNVFSQPPSREESVCGEPDRTSILLDRFQNCNMSNYANFQNPQNFSSANSPVFPQMQYNGHVHIPQPRFPQNGQNVFGQQYGRNMFKAPGGSGLIRLPQTNSR